MPTMRRNWLLGRQNYSKRFFFKMSKPSEQDGTDTYLQFGLLFLFSRELSKLEMLWRKYLDKVTSEIRSQQHFTVLIMTALSSISVKCNEVVLVCLGVTNT